MTNQELAPTPTVVYMYTNTHDWACAAITNYEGKFYALCIEKEKHYTLLEWDKRKQELIDMLKNTLRALYIGYSEEDMRNGVMFKDKKSILKWERVCKDIDFNVEKKVLNEAMSSLFASSNRPKHESTPIFSI